MVCRLQGQYSRASMPSLLYSLCHFYAIKSKQKQCTQMSVLVYTTIAIIPVCDLNYVRVLTVELNAVWVTPR
jgi:hypothetical protein